MTTTSATTKSSTGQRATAARPTGAAKPKLATTTKAPAKPKTTTSAKPKVASTTKPKVATTATSTAKPKVASTAKPKVAVAETAATPVAAPAVAEPRAERGILHYLGLGLSGGLFGIMLLIAVVVVIVPLVAHATPYTVLTSSMEPKLPPGTLIVDLPVAAENVHVGDVITYQLESGKPVVVTHRVIGISTADTGAKTFTLKGDNNSLPDANPVASVQIRGKLWYSVPLVGWINNMVNGTTRGWIVPIIAFVLFLYAGYMLASSVNGAAKKRRQARAAAEEQAPSSTT